MLLSLCVFTCYWGIDETPVVVGLRAASSSTDSDAAADAGVSGGSGREGGSREEGASAVALSQQLRQLKVGAGLAQGAGGEQACIWEVETAAHSLLPLCPSPSPHCPPSTV